MNASQITRGFINKCAVFRRFMSHLWFHQNELNDWVTLAVVVVLSFLNARRYLDARIRKWTFRSAAMTTSYIASDHLTTSNTLTTHQIQKQNIYQQIPWKMWTAQKWRCKCLYACVWKWLSGSSHHYVRMGYDEHFNIFLLAHLFISHQDDILVWLTNEHAHEIFCTHFYISHSPIQWRLSRVRNFPFFI